MLQLRLKQLFIVTLLFSFIPTTKAFIRPCIIPGDPSCKSSSNNEINIDEAKGVLLMWIVLVFGIIVIGFIICITENVERYFESPEKKEERENKDRKEKEEREKNERRRIREEQWEIENEEREIEREIRRERKIEKMHEDAEKSFERQRLRK